MILTFFNREGRFSEARFSLAPRIRGNGRMMVLVAWLAVAGCIAAVPSAHAQFVTRNSFIEGDVSNDGFGYITIYYFDANNVKQKLSFTNFSFLTVNVNGTYYSNNSNLSSGIDESTGSLNTPQTLLKNGATVIVKGTSAGTDTIRTTWQPQGANAFDIIQDVYPVASASTGQIVYKWSIRNNQTSYLPAQIQFLLDVETSSGSQSNDDPKITTREGYNESAGADLWHNFTTLPPYFITSEFDLCTTNFPGVLGAGFLNDSLAPVAMGLRTPSLMANVDLKQYVLAYIWGYPSGLNNTPMSNDNAIIFQWPLSGVSGEIGGKPNVQELGRGCFGLPPCEPIAFGNLDALLLHVDHVVWSPPVYLPNTFPVEAVVWNSSGNSAHGAIGSQSIANAVSGLPGPVKIISPTPVSNNGYTQSHPLRSGGSQIVDSAVDACSAAYITWEDTVLQSVLVNCSTDSIYNITFSIPAATGVGNTRFITGPYFCPVTVDCEQKDLTPPRHTNHIYSDLDKCGHPLKCTIDSVFDNLPTDLGVQSITFTESPANSVTVTGTSVTGGVCPPTVGPILMTQTDTLRDACVDFTYTDCAGNVSFDTVCFGHCTPLVPIDTLAPKFRLLNEYHWSDSNNVACGFQCGEWMVTDTVIDGLQQDLGLDSISVVSESNMSFTLLSPVIPGMKRDSFTVCVTDSMQGGTIVIRAKDAATPANFSYDTITYCTVADTNKPVVSIQLPTASGVPVQVTEAKPWDRGIRQVLVTSVEHPLGINYCRPLPGSGPMTIDSINDSTWLILPDSTCPLLLDFKVAITDSFAEACFTVQATDCAGNISYPPQAYCSNALFDTFCPKIDTTTTGQKTLSVTISDIHVQGGDTIGYDEGIDSIWFTCANNITLTDSAGNTWNSSNNTLPTLHGQPTGGDHPRFQKVIHFTLSVTDTNSQNGEPCVCINAIDGATPPNTLNCTGVFQWCSSLNQDTAAPKITTTPTCTALDVVATDSETNDRGIHRVWLDSLTNFAPLDDSTHSGDKVVPFTLQIPDQDSSSYARLSTIDVYGDESTLPSVKAAHTTSSDVWVYKQDLVLSGSGIAESNTTFLVPVFLSKTDTFPMSQKQLWEYQFTFHLTGSPLVTFIGTKLPASNAAKLPGWTVTPAPGAAIGAPPYAISGQGPPLTNLEASDTLVYLEFSAASTTDVQETQIAIDQEQCGAQVIFNGGNDTTISTADYSITLPAPSGRLNAGTVIIKDSCTTVIGDHPHPTILSLAPLAPNPVTSDAARTVRVQYTVPAEAPVLLELYDELGRNVRTLVAQVQKQGTYQLTLDANGLADGTYFLRLASSGQVCSQRILIIGQ